MFENINSSKERKGERYSLKIEYCNTFYTNSLLLENHTSGGHSVSRDKQLHMYNLDNKQSDMTFTIPTQINCDTYILKRPQEAEVDRELETRTKKRLRQGILHLGK